MVSLLPLPLCLDLIILHIIMAKKQNSGSSPRLPKQRPRLCRNQKKLTDMSSSYSASQSMDLQHQNDKTRVRNQKDDCWVPRNEKKDRQILNPENKNESEEKMAMRVKKEAKYSSLETLTMRMLKDQKLYHQSKEIARKNQIPEQKNYSIIGLRLGLLMHHRIRQQKKSQKEAAQQIQKYFKQKLNDCLKEKYEESNSQRFIQKVRIKNQQDINVLIKIFKSNMRYTTVLNYVKDLYEPKQGCQFAKKNEGFAKKVAQVIVQAYKKGKQFDSNHNVEQDKDLQQSRHSDQLADTPHFMVSKRSSFNRTSKPPGPALMSLNAIRPHRSQFSRQESSYLQTPCLQQQHKVPTPQSPRALRSPTLQLINTGTIIGKKKRTILQELDAEPGAHQCW